MDKFIPVEPEKWAEMVKAQAEVERLKAEVERLTSDLQMEKENEDRIVRLHQKANNEVYGLRSQVAALIDDQTHLKAELAKSEEHNAALCERMQDLNSELHTCSCANAKMNMHMNENARLKAEVSELADGLKLASEVGIKMADEVTHLKAEVERLNTGIQPEGSNDAVGRAVNVLLEKEKENARLKAEVELWKLRSDNWQKLCQLTRPDMTDEVNRLKAEVEQSKRINTELLVLSERQASDIRRLTKAGDAMLSEWSSGDEKDANNFRKALVIWNAAKKGGQP